MSEVTQPLSRVSDVIESSFQEFYPLATKTSIEAVMALGEVIILDTLIVENFETKYGTHPLAVVAVTPRSNDPAILSFATSGQVVLDKLRQLKARAAFPILGSFVMDKRYYDLR